MKYSLQAEQAADIPAAPTARRSAAALSLRDRVFLGILLVGTLLKGVLWSQLVFPLDAPDEPSHFNYVMQVHAFHGLPKVFMETPSRLGRGSTSQDDATRAMLDKYGFTAFRGMPYESSQPPLYYVAAAAFITPLGEDRLTLMYAVRLVSVLFGVGAVWAVWWGVRRLWPDAPLVVWAVPLALSLHPQFTFVTSTITNDAGAIFFGALIFAVWAAGLRAAQGGEVSLIGWGLLAGAITALGLLTKLTMVVTLPPTLLWLWWLAQPHGEPVPLFNKSRLLAVLKGAVTAGAAIVVLVGWWVLRNVLVYGDPTGTRGVFAIYHSIYWRRHNFPDTQLFSGFALDDFAEKTFQSFWAIYGWVAVTLPLWLYLAALLLSLIAVAGLLRAWLGGRTARPRPDISQARMRLGWLCALLGVLSLVNMLFYVSFVDYQPQARYLFVALGPAIFLLVLGLRRVAARPRLATALVWAFVGLLFLMQVFSVPALLDRWAHMAF